jgi:hypothetical protein
MATTKGILIPASMDEEVQVVDIDTDNYDRLHELVFGEGHKASDGGTLDFASFRARGVQMCFDDLGLYDQPNNINPRAMALWAELAGRGVADFAVPLVGNYVVLGLHPYDGETMDVPVEVVAMLIAKPIPE